MTNEDLKVYRKEKTELYRLGKKINKIQSIKIKNREKIIYSAKLERFKKKEKKVVEFINCIDDDFEKKIIELRYLRIMSWERVAQIVGGGNTADSVRMIAKRALKKGGG